MIKIENTDVLNKFRIIVPRGIRFISEWSDYSLMNFQFPHILDKKLPGCGYTEYCLRSDMNVIVVSPRRVLLENKEAQHKGDVLYFTGTAEPEITGYDKDLESNRLKNPTIPVTELDKVLEDIDKGKYSSDEFIRRMNIVSDYINMCLSYRKPMKILVTYDSFRFLRAILECLQMFDYFYTIVDEFQSIFTDSKFKSTTELAFVNSLKGIRNLCYVSATPMIYEYLVQLDEFKDLPYYELDWSADDPDRVVKPSLTVKYLNSIGKESSEIIKTYLDGQFEMSYVNGCNVISNEAVFFVNSVKNITTIIKKNNLTPDQCNILCANTIENRKRIKRILGRGFDIGSVPLFGEPHKMFTFCTRTVYLGADFYSKCARTFIFSDANIDSMSVDITLDLPQIMGRQRLSDNPWAREAIIYAKSVSKDKRITVEAFTKRISEKVKNTKLLMSCFNDYQNNKDTQILLGKQFQTVARVENYKDNYVACDKIGSDLVPADNKLVRLAEIRAFQIQQIDYKDRFSVFNSFDKLDKSGQYVVSSLDADIENWRNIRGKSFSERFKNFCESKKYTDDQKKEISLLISARFSNYYNNLSDAERRKAEYSIPVMDKMIEKKGLLTEENIPTVEELFEKEFIVGNKYTKKEIKEKIGEIYEKTHTFQTPKASDIEKYFNIKNVMTTNKATGKRDAGFEIISKN